MLSVKIQRTVDNTFLNKIMKDLYPRIFWYINHPIAVEGTKNIVLDLKMFNLYTRNLNLISLRLAECNQNSTHFAGIHVV